MYASGITFIRCSHNIAGADSGGGGGGGGATGARPPPPPSNWKNVIFWRKIVIFTRNTPKIFAPPSARRNFFKCAPPPPPNMKSWIRPCIGKPNDNNTKQLSYHQLQSNIAERQIKVKLKKVV